jgi:hypothetical protein
MNNQTKRSKKNTDTDPIQIVVNVDEMPIEIRKKSSDEPIYITHL